MAEQQQAETEKEVPTHYYNLTICLKKCMKRVYMTHTRQVTGV